MTSLPDGPWLSLLILAVLLLVVFRRPLAWLLRVLGRSVVGLGFLAIWAESGVLAGLSLGLLGIPGLGLLLLLRWLSLS